MRMEDAALPIFISFTVLFVAGAVSTVQFDFTSDPVVAIDVDEHAKFHCSVNDTRVVISWFFNGSSNIPSNIIQNGTGTSSNLAIPGLSQYNNTLVRCVAFGYLDNNVRYDNFSEFTLKIQGALAAVKNLLFKRDCLCVECSWGPPFSLTPVSEYVYIITGDNSQIINSSTNINNTIFCPSQYGRYNISVAANNNAGLGNVTSDIVDIPKCILSMHVMNTTNTGGEWNITIYGNASCFNTSADYFFSAYMNNEEVEEGKIDQSRGFKNDLYVTTLYLGKLPKNFWNLSVSMQYPRSGLFINMSEPVMISTYSIRNPQVTNMESRGFCFSVSFFNGSSSNESLVELRGDTTAYNGSVIIGRDNGTACTTDLANDKYTITFYDGGDIVESFVRVIDAASDVSTTVAFTTTLLSETPSPSQSFEEPEMTENNFKAIAIAISSVFVIAIIALMIVLVFVLVHRRSTYSKTSPNKTSPNETNPSPGDMEEQQVCDPINCIPTYCDTEISEDRPRAPPSMEQRVQYNEVLPGDQTINTGLYSRASPVQDQQLDNSEYSRLNTRGYRSPHQPDFACNDAKNNELYSTIASTASQHNCSFTVNTELTHGALTKYVVPHISDKWYEMGLALALTPDDLEELRGSNQELSDVFMMWEDNKTRPFTWDTLITTLRSINEHDLAEQLLNMRQ